MQTRLSRLREATQRFIEALTLTQRERRLQPLVKDLEKRLRAYFGEQWRLFMAELDAVKSTHPAKEALVIDPFAEWWWEYIEWEWLLNKAMAKTATALIRPVDEAVSAAYLMGGRSFIADIDMPISFNLANPRAIAYLDQYGAELVKKIDDATKNYIHDVLAKGRREGWGYDEMAKAITERYADFAVGRPQKHIDSRAHLIAVQETGEAYEQAAFDQAAQMEEDGMIMEKHWLSSGDERTCTEICIPNAAAGWIPLHQAFPSTHQRALGHVACRCGTEYRRMKQGRT